MIIGLLALTSMGYSCCGAASDDDFSLDYDVEKESEFYAFVSLSMPKNTLKEISNHLEKIGGIFVFRGLPKGSFSEFLKEVAILRELGINANIMIDPDLFEENDINAVPAFVYVDADEAKQKIVGNVSVPFVLREMGVKS
jgi:conjugal transfer pilus assembly protein TrbC